MTEELFDWFQYEVDIAIAEPEEDKVKGGLCGGALRIKELSQPLLEEVERGGGHFVLRVDVTPEDFWLRVRASTEENNNLDGDVVFISLGRRNGERLRDALDAALKLREPRAEGY